MEGLAAMTLLHLSGNTQTVCLPPTLRAVADNDLDRLGLSDCTEEGAAPALEGLGVSLTGDTFSVSWSAASGAALYKVLYRTGGAVIDPVSAATTTAGSLTFSPEGGPGYGTVYEFIVRCCSGRVRRDSC